MGTWSCGLTENDSQTSPRSTATLCMLWERQVTQNTWVHCDVIRYLQPKHWTTLTLETDPSVHGVSCQGNVRLNNNETGSRRVCLGQSTEMPGFHSLVADWLRCSDSASVLQVSWCCWRWWRRSTCVKKVSGNPICSLSLPSVQYSGGCAVTIPILSDHSPSTLIYLWFYIIGLVHTPSMFL